MPYPILENEIKTLWNLLGFGKERFAEVRCVDINGRSGVVSREYINDSKALRDWAISFNGHGNCFVGRAYRGYHKEVLGFQAISLDIDPIREKGKAATATQTQEAINAGNRILDKHGGGFLAATGNGCLVIWGTSLPILDAGRFKEFEGKLKLFQDECQALVGQGKVKIDATQDTPRLLKLIGTVSVKGAIRPTRFLRLASGGRNGDEVFGYVERISPSKPQDREVLLSKSLSDDRSRNDFALASHYHRQGLGPYDILDALKHHAIGRPERSDDHRRIVEKICGVRWNGNQFAKSDSHVQSSLPPINVHTPMSSLSVYMEGLNKRMEHKTPELQTGFKELDEATNGLRRGDIYTVAARPGVGKTSFLVNVAVGLAAASKSVLLLSTEMSYSDIWDRALSGGTGINASKFGKGLFSEEEKEKLNLFVEKFKTFSIRVCDSFNPKLETVVQAVQEQKPDVLIFDHIQHIEGGEDWKALSAFVQGLKRVAMEHKIAIVIASQLRRPSYSPGGEAPKPSMNDLKGCGRIEEESAFVLLLYPMNQEIADGTAVVRAELVKNRYGPNVTLDLAFVQNITKFKSMEEFIGV